MKRSESRILTTHTGSLPRPDDLVAFFLEAARCFVVRRLGVGELAELLVRERDVVEHLCFVIAESERLVAKLAQTKGFESCAQITANQFDGAEVLIDHRYQSAVSGQFSLGTRCLVHSRGLIEIAGDLVHDSNDVESLRNRGWRAEGVSGCDRCFEDVERGASVPLLEICPAQPPQRGEPGVRVRVGVAHETLVYRAGVRPPAFALGLFGALDALLDGGRFSRLQFDCWPAVGHDSATAVPERALSRGCPLGLSGQR